VKERARKTAHIEEKERQTDNYYYKYYNFHVETRCLGEINFIVENCKNMSKNLLLLQEVLFEELNCFFSLQRGKLFCLLG
jgi:hypothetical protein